VSPEGVAGVAGVIPVLEDEAGVVVDGLVDVSGDESGNAVGWFVGVFDELGVMELGVVSGND
jgi:hypothetical protein